MASCLSWRERCLKNQCSPSSCCCGLILSAEGSRDWSEPKMNWNFWSFKCVNFWTGIDFKKKTTKNKGRTAPPQSCFYQGCIPGSLPLWYSLFSHHVLLVTGAPFWTVFLLSCWNNGGRWPNFNWFIFLTIRGNYVPVTAFSKRHVFVESRKGK